MGMYATPFEKRPKQLELIQAVEDYKVKTGIEPTADRLAQAVKEFGSRFGVSPLPAQIEHIKNKLKAETGNLPTAHELSKIMGLSLGCVYERVKALKKHTGIQYTRIMDDAERIERSLKSRRE